MIDCYSANVSATTTTSKPKYLRKLESWGLKKNLNSVEWNYVFAKVEKRKREEGKESEVFVNGERLDAKKIKTKQTYATNRSEQIINSKDPRKQIYYKGPTSNSTAKRMKPPTTFGTSSTRTATELDQLERSSDTAPVLLAVVSSPGKTPQNVLVRTPGSMLDFKTLELPWFSFEKEFDEILARTSFNAIRPDVFELLSSRWSTTGMIQMVQMPTPPPDPQPHAPTTANLSTTSTGTSNSIVSPHGNQMTPEAIPRAYNYLRTLLPEQEKGQFLKELQKASESPQNFFMLQLKHCMNMASNNLLSDQQMDSMLSGLEEIGQLDIAVRALCNLESAGARSFSEAVLCSAVRRYKVDLVRYLLIESKTPVNPNLSHFQEGSLFCFAIARLASWQELDDSSELDVYLESKNRKIDEDEDGEELGDDFDDQIHAWYQDNQEIIKIFIEAGVDLERGNPNTPLQNAILLILANQQGLNYHFTRALELEDTRLSDHPGFRILQLLLENRTSLVDRGLDATQTYTPLQFALRHGSNAPPHNLLQIVSRLIEAGADVNDMPPEGYQKGASGRLGGEDLLPIHSFTALQLHTSLYQFFDVSEANYYDSRISLTGRRRLSEEAKCRASTSEHIEIVKTILRNTTIPNVTVNAPPGAYYGRTALQGAAEAGCIEIVLLLLEQNAEVNAKPSYYGGLSALQAAALWGRDDIVEILLEHGADVNGPPAEMGGCTALQAAIQFGSCTIVQKLLKRGANPNLTGVSELGFFTTALELALSSISSEITAIQQRQGAKMKSQTDDVSAGRTWRMEDLLEDSNYLQFLEILKLLIKAGADPFLWDSNSDHKSPIDSTLEINSPEVSSIMAPYIETAVQRALLKDGGNCILRALLKGPITRLETFIKDRGLRVNNSETLEGLPTVLQMAYFEYTGSPTSENARRFSLILDAGGNINASAASKGSYNLNLTILQCAINKASLDLLKSKSDSSTESENNNKFDPEIRVLLELGADINAPAGSRGGKTALQIAIALQNFDLVEQLLDLGANPNSPAAAWEGVTALQLASFQGNLDLVHRLLGRGADVNSKFSPPNGQTPVQAAAERGHLDVVRILAAKGADLDAEPAPKRGLNALQRSITNDNTEMTNLLLELKANVNAPAYPISGRTALQAAVQSGKIELVTLLVDKWNAKVNQAPAPDRGVTALQAAAIKGHLGIVVLLLERGADPNSPGAKTEGRTALDGAAENGRLDIVKILLECGAGRKRKAASMKFPSSTQMENKEGEPEMEENQWEYDCGNAIRLARQEGHHAVVSLLREYYKPSALDITLDMDPFAFEGHRDDFNGWF